MKHKPLHVWPRLATSLVFWGVLSAGCSGKGDAPPVSSAHPATPGAAAASSQAGARAQAPDGREFLAAADARTMSPALRSGLLAGAEETRALATLALARMHHPAQAAELRSALRDPSSAVRQAASLGLGALEADAPPGTDAALLGALAVERDGATRVALLNDLGRIASDTAEPAFRAALEADQPAEREAACRGLGAVGLRGRSVEAPLLRLVVSRAAEDAAPSVRLACTYALSRLPAPPPSSAETTAAVVAELGRTTRDPDPEVRLMAARALSKYPSAPVEIITTLTRDADWRVAAQAFRTLARRSSVGSDGPYASALRAELERQLRPTPAPAPPGGAAPAAQAAQPTHLVPPTAHVLLVALDEAAGVATGVNVAPVAEDALRRLTLPQASATRADGLAHCLAAKLVDLARGWPQRLTHCGLGQVGESERSVRMAEVLQATTGDAAGRAGYLLRLYEHGDARVREAVLTAAALVDDPLAARLVLRGLEDSDVGVVTSALDAVAAKPGRLLATAAGSPDAVDGGPPSVAPQDASQPGPGARLATDARSALGSAYRTLSALDELEGLQAWLEAVRTVRDPAFVPEARELSVHSNGALRHKARETLEQLGAAPNDAPPNTIANALTAVQLPRSTERISVVLSTPGGEVEIALLPADAPTTVARFVALAERGFYDGLRFHRVVAAFVAQGGDPRGDGYGGPGYSQRCEDNRVRYERGTVGMALAGRDTGGSQFFISQAAQPHLDGRYTAFGRVVRGMDIVDRLLPEDALTRVRIVRGTGITSDTAP